MRIAVKYPKDFGKMFAAMVPQPKGRPRRLSVAGHDIRRVRAHERRKIKRAQRRVAISGRLRTTLWPGATATRFG